MEDAVASRAIDPHVVTIEARRVAAARVAPVVAIGELARYDRWRLRRPATTTSCGDAWLFSVASRNRGRGGRTSDNGGMN